MKEKMGYLSRQIEKLKVENQQLKQLIFLQNLTPQNKDSIIYELKVENTKLRDELLDHSAKSLLQAQVHENMIAQYEREIQDLQKTNRSLKQQIAQMQIYLTKAQLIGHPNSKERKKFDQLLDSFPIQIWQMINLAQTLPKREEFCCSFHCNNDELDLTLERESELQTSFETLKKKKRVPFLKMEHIKQTRIKLQQEKNKRTMGQKKVANVNHECVELLKISYVEAIFQLCQSKQTVFRYQKYIEQLEARNSQILKLVENSSQK